MYFRSIHILLHRILRNQRSIHSPFSTSFSFGEVSRFERHNIVTYPKTSTPYESAITTVWVKPATQPREVTSPWPKIKSRICDPTKSIYWQFSYLKPSPIEKNVYCYKVLVISHKFTKFKPKSTQLLNWICSNIFLI